jgi:hypothetical protein
MLFLSALLFPLTAMAQSSNEKSLDQTFDADTTLKETVTVGSRQSGNKLVWEIKPGVTVKMDSHDGAQILSAMRPGPFEFVIKGGGTLYSRRVKEYGIRLGHAIDKHDNIYGGPCTFIIEEGCTAQFDTEIAIYPSGGNIQLKGPGSRLLILSTNSYNSIDTKESILKTRHHYGSKGVGPITINGKPIQVDGPDANAVYALVRVEGVIYHSLKALPSESDEKK